MAEKILQTRIINKHTTYDAAISNETFIPKLGEIVLAKLDVQQNDGQTVPTFLMKVGDGETALKGLNWLHAPASDVYSWAKAATKPGYNASEITRGTGSNVNADLTALESAVDTLQGLVGGNKDVATMISEAINALDVDASTDADGIIISSISETDGKISVTRRAISANDIPELAIAKITGLQDALDAKADETATQEALDTINSTITDTLTPAIEDAQDAAEAAQTYAEGIYKAGEGEAAATGVLATYMTTNDAEVAAVRAIAEAAQTAQEVSDAISNFNTTRVTPIDERLTTVEGVVGNAESGLVKGLADEITRATGVEGGLDTRLTAAENAIATLNAATTFAGTGTYAEMLAKDVAAGSIFVVVDNTEEGKQYNNKEFVFDGTNWVELGDTTAELAEITGLKNRMDAVEAENATQGTAIEAAQDAADAAQASADAIYKVTDGTASGFLADEIARATKAESDNLAEAKQYAEDEADAAETAAKAHTTTEIGKVNEAIEALTSTVNTNAQTAANATKAVADDLAAYKTSNNTAVEKAQSDATRALTDAAAAQKTADDNTTAITNLTEGQVKTNKEATEANALAIGNLKTDVETNYVRVNGDNLVYGQGDAEMTIIFDCGGVEE